MLSGVVSEVNIVKWKSFGEGQDWLTWWGNGPSVMLK